MLTGMHSKQRSPKVFPRTPQSSLLAILNELDITDKHRLLLTSVGVMQANRHGRAWSYRGQEPTPEYHWGVLEEGRPIATFRCSEPSPGMHVSDFEMIPDVSLADVGAHKDEVDATELLWTIHKHVWGVVLTFEPF